jgi:DNA primase
MIPNEIIDQILDKIDIVEVISGYIPLKKAGQNFRTNCPFHNEKTPSFTVSPSKQIYHCFGCGAGGNVISFLMKHESMDFIEAIKMLAGKAAVRLPALSAAGKAKNSFAEKLYDVNNIACDFYRQNLMKESAGAPYKYLVERGLTERTIKHFRFGFAEDSWRGLLEHCKRKGVEADLPAKAGLILQSADKGNWYDRFRNRIMFPIFDSRGRILGFGGRALDENTMPKYINSPETYIYTKGRHLYGLNFAREFIKKKNYAVIVEGYFDLIMPFQNDIKNIAATLGTALTVEQIALLKRLTKNVIMVYDSDKAGEAATLRGLDLLIREDMNIRIAVLPKGSDPDSFVRKEKGPGFMKVLKESKDLFDYKLGVLTSKFKKSEPRGKARIVEEMLPTLAKIKNAVLKSSYLKKMAEALSVDEESVRTELKKVKPDAGEAYSAPVDAKKTKHENLAELTLLSLVLEDASFIKKIEEELGLGSFKDKSISAVLDKVGAFYKDGKKITPSHLISYFEDSTIEEVVSEAVSIGHTMQDKNKGFGDCVRHIKKRNLKEALKASTDINEVNKLLRSTVNKNPKNI